MSGLVAANATEMRRHKFTTKRPTHTTDPAILTLPEYLRRLLSCGGRHHLVVFDRYSNWPIVEESADGAKGLISVLRRIIVTYGISKELTSDGGPKFTASVTESFLRNWGVQHRMMSVAFLYGNWRGSRCQIGESSTLR